MSLVRDFNYPLFYENALAQLGTTRAQMSRDRYWKSVPRSPQDGTWEVLQVNFRKPVSVAQISFEVTEMNQQYELWYYDRRGARVAVLDRSRQQFKGNIGAGEPNKWVKVERQTYPFVATRVELRVRRVADIFGNSNAFSVCVRNFLCKRNVLDRDDAEMPFEIDVDHLGNLVTRTVKDWDAAKAADNNAYTFWKSEPQPDPEAVVSMYLDVRDADGKAQRVDRLWLDPVYSGQSMNIYYSSDDTVGTRRLSTSKMAPVVQTNAPVGDDGLRLSESTSLYQLRCSDFGFDLYSGPWWYAFTWVPDFNSNSSGLSNNLVLFNTGKISIQYLYGDSSIAVVVGKASAKVPVSFAELQQVKIALAVDQTSAHLNVQVGSNLVKTDSIPLASTVNSGTIEIRNVEGVITDLALKEESMTDDQFGLWAQNTEVFLSPDPVLEDQQGRLPSTTLDNMVLGANFLYQELPNGGMDSSFFESKVWDPVWRDYTVTRGFYFLPLPIYAKYIKLEFTDLTEEAYPVWESGIDVKYKTFPVSVIETAKRVDTLNTKKTTTTRTTTTVTNGKKTVSKAASAVYNTYGASADTYDMQISLGSGLTTADVPHLYDKPVETDWRREVATRTVFARSNTATSTIRSAKKQAEAAYYTVVSGDWLIKIGKKYHIPWKVIYQANKQMIDSDPRVRRLPKRSQGWWIFPGQKLKIPAAVMKQIITTTTKTTTTNTTVTERKTTTTSRRRFQTSSVHRYEIQTARRDSAMAYFAGIREVQVFLLNYLAKEDTPVYDITYLDNTFTFQDAALGDDNVTRPTSPGGMATSDTYQSMGTFKRIEFDSFDRGLQRGGGSASTLQAVGLNTQAPTANWDDDTVSWDSPIATWGAGSPFVTVGVDANYFFAGQAAAKVTRVSGKGAAGVTTTPFAAGVSAPSGTRMRLSAQMFRFEDTKNKYTLNIVDGSAGDAIIYSEEIKPELGTWDTYQSRFFSFSGAYSKMKVQLIIDGPDSETFYVGNINAEFTSIVYEVSNDGGNNWYEATEVVNRENGYFVFPTEDNRLRFRVTMGSPYDIVYGVRITPLYLR